MKEEDLSKVLTMRNHPSVRAASLDEKVISEEEHQKWWETSPSIKMVYLMNGEIIGVVAVKMEPENTAEWSFYLDQEKELAKGTGFVMLQEVIRAFPMVSKWVASVKNENKKSIRLHEKLGFVRVSKLEWVKEVNGD